MDPGQLIQAQGYVLSRRSSDYGFESPITNVAAYPVTFCRNSLLRQACRLLLKWKWLIVACFGVVLSLVTVATYRMTPIYEASARLAINKADSSGITFKDFSQGDVSGDSSEIDTQVKILQSDTLALEVIKQLDLEHNPTVAGANAARLAMEKGSSSRLRSTLLQRFRSNLKVTRLPNTRILEITFTSPDPELAASIVNTLQAAFIEQNFKTKYESTMQTSDWLSKQLMDLQLKAEASQEKLVQYQKEHGIFGIDEKQNITTAKLEELNRELTAAQADRAQKEALDRLADSGTPDMVVTASAGNSGTSPLSSLFEKLRDQKATLEIKRAELSSQFGPAFPKLVQVNNQLTQIDSEIQAETRKLRSSVHNQYLAASAREKLLQGMFDNQKAQANQLNENAIAYSTLKHDVEANRQLYEGLLQKLKEAGIAASLRSTSLRVVDAASTPTAPSEPNIPRNLAFGGLSGLLSGVLLALLFEGMDNCVHTSEQAQLVSELPSLGTIPFLNGKKEVVSGKPMLPSVVASQEPVELVTQARPQSQMSESYRALRTSLLLSSLGAPPKVVLITSALPQEGKTTTSTNCAIVLAQKGARVLLIDADLRRPSVHRALGLDECLGLSNVLTGTTDLQTAVKQMTSMPNLHLLPAGPVPPNPSELLASDEMKNVLNELRRNYDHIVIDSPPALSVTDAAVLSAYADGVMLVIRSGQTTKQALRRTRNLLTQVNAKLRGVLLNAADVNSPDHFDYSEYSGKNAGRYYSGEKAG